MEIKIDCPFCGKIKHFYVNTAKGVYHCFKCGEGGRLSGDLIKYVTKSGHRISPSKATETKLQLPKGLRPITKHDELYWSYAKKRNALQFRDKLYIAQNYPEYLTVGLPLLPHSSPPTFLFGRKLLLAGPRYRYYQNTKGVIAKSFLGKVERGVIVEGFFDLTNMCKILPTIALLGKGWDDIKIKKIHKFITKKIYICLDKDALKDVFQLCSFFPDREVKILHTDVFKDPGQDVNWVKDLIERGY